MNEDLCLGSQFIRLLYVFVYFVMGNVLQLLLFYRTIFWIQSTILQLNGAQTTDVTREIVFWLKAFETLNKSSLISMTLVVLNFSKPYERSMKFKKKVKKTYRLFYCVTVILNLLQFKMPFSFVFFFSVPNTRLFCTFF